MKINIGDKLKIGINSSIKIEGKNFKYINLIGNNDKKENLEFNLNIKEKDDVVSLNKIGENTIS